MNIVLNGVVKTVDDHLSLSNLLFELQDFQTRHVTLVNGIIIKKEDYERTYLRNTDSVEIVSIVGGG